jgi:hypothetical protein
MKIRWYCFWLLSIASIPLESFITHDADFVHEKSPDWLARDVITRTRVGASGFVSFQLFSASQSVYAANLKWAQKQDLLT